MKECKHHWVVFSTCTGTVELMCECVNCHAFGVVPQPTIKEWEEGFHAPSHPYRWHDNSRVITKDPGSPDKKPMYVMSKIPNDDSEWIDSSDYPEDLQY